MKQLMILFILFLSAGITMAQTNVPKDSLVTPGKVMVFKDSRIDALAKIEADYNEALALSSRAAMGYRLMLLSTSDRAEAMSLRGKLLQRFPEQKVYMSFQPPYIKLKFGNFLEKTEADQYIKEIGNGQMVSTNIYLVPEVIELKSDKNKDKDNIL